ncbi:MAG: ABC transporter ATP-binding protein [Microbacterium sp.]|uniref:dipeptide ABC transporter ATP-binding protein n=1 Tax=Microbacterium sp. TaxID=51671 RepID=UPI0039E6FB36
MSDLVASPAPALDVAELEVRLTNGQRIVSEVAFAVTAGEIVALVGESGSGKTTVSMATLGYARQGARLTAGRVRVRDGDVLAMDAAARRSLRGRTVAYVPQDPSVALNPALRIGRQLREVIEVHRPGTAARQKAQLVTTALTDVGLPGDREFQDRYPHQLSGGQQQRVALAMAMILRPEVLVMDEPTTGLDVTTQAKILDLIRTLCATHAVGVLYVTHDLAVVAELADRVLVMRAGRIVEEGRVAEVFAAPAHAYTRELLAAVPSLRERTSPAPPARAASAEPLLSVRELSAAHGDRTVLHGIGFDLDGGECLALVGESGSGKSTLARCLIGLHDRHSGRILLHGEQVPTRARRRRTELRRAFQYVFQSPHSSLNPRRTVRDIVAQPYNIFFSHDRRETAAAVAEVLDRVGLPARAAGLTPRDLSGGERQRVAIARSLICRPDVLICDEVTSALDVSIQAAVVDLLAGLQRERDMSMLFVTHNVALVRQIADRVLVMNQGRIVESGRTAEVLDRPREDYTQRLIRDTPTLPDRAAPVR